MDELADLVIPIQMRRRDNEEQKNELSYKLHQMQMEEFELEFDSPTERTAATKLIVLGAPGVGKSSLIRRFASGLFNETYEPSLG